MNRGDIAYRIISSHMRGIYLDKNNKRYPFISSPRLKTPTLPQPPPVSRSKPPLPPLSKPSHRLQLFHPPICYTYYRNKNTNLYNRIISHSPSQNDQTVANARTTPAHGRTRRTNELTDSFRKTWRTGRLRKR